MYPNRALKAQAEHKDIIKSIKNRDEKKMMMAVDSHINCLAAEMEMLNSSSFLRRLYPSQLVADFCLCKTYCDSLYSTIISYKFSSLYLLLIMMQVVHSQNKNKGFFQLLNFHQRYNFLRKDLKL